MTIFGAFAGGVVSGLAENAINAALDHRAAAQAAARAADPIRRLGICGIGALRRSFAANEVDELLEQIAAEEGMDSARYATDVRPLLTHAGITDHVFWAGEHIVALSSVADDLAAPLPYVVDWVDHLATALTELAGSGARVTAIVCTEQNLEPRPVPTPSGRSAIVTGPSWLMGVIRQVIGLTGTAHLDRTPEPLPSWTGLRSFTSRVRPVRQELECIRSELLNLPAASWWVVPGLCLDVGAGAPLGLAVIGRPERSSSSILNSMARWNARCTVHGASAPTCASPNASRSWWTATHRTTATWSTGATGASVGR